MDELSHTPFDTEVFAAEMTLELIPTEKLPAIAQDALEAGYDGPAVVRMAILDPNDGWAIRQTLPKMLAELGCPVFDLQEAALWLARRRARKILADREDPLLTIGYFDRLLWSANYPSELYELAYLPDDFYLAADDAEARAWVVRALENLLSPELREER